MRPRDILVVNLSGRGDKDMGILARELKIQGA
jgi:tryptophan synthase beta chain